MTFGISYANPFCHLVSCEKHSGNVRRKYLVTWSVWSHTSTTDNYVTYMQRCWRYQNKSRYTTRTWGYLPVQWDQIRADDTRHVNQIITSTRVDQHPGNPDFKLINRKPNRSWKENMNSICRNPRKVFIILNTQAYSSVLVSHVTQVNYQWKEQEPLSRTYRCWNWRTISKLTSSLQQKIVIYW